MLEEKCHRAHLQKKGTPRILPISAQSPVLYKILAAIMRKRMFKYLSQNKLINQEHQKGFWPLVDGVGEHTETLTHVIREAERHQNGLVVTLLDL